MRILITGANGFIGSQIVATLRASGHQIVCAVRKLHRQEQFPNCEIIYCDFNRDVIPEVWEPRLTNIDVVINCVGILQAQRNQSIKAIHELAPQALFNACHKMSIKRIIHISALGADLEVGTAYASTKYAAEKHLMALNIDWVILRPSLVFTQGSYGGTSLMRAIAALPWIIPVIGDGQQYFQPIYMQDLSEIVKCLVEKSGVIQKKLDVVGPEKISYQHILTSFRQWLNFRKAKIVHIPISLIKGVVKVGKWLGIASLNTTSLKMLMYGNTTTEINYQELINTVGFAPRAFSTELFSRPSYVQDRWHARLFFLKPLLRISLAMLWLGSGIVSLIPPQLPQLQLLEKMGISSAISAGTLWSFSFLDIVLGLATLLNWQIKKISVIQFYLILFYTMSCSIYFPALWLQPFAPLLKNIPILIATLIMIAIAEDR